MRRVYELTNERWELVADLFDPPGRRGPKAKEPRRQMVEVVLWLARTGVSVAGTARALWRRAVPAFHANGGRFGRIKGTKRAVAVAVLGLPVAALADAASNDDTVLVGRLLDEHAPRLPRLEVVMGDRGFRNLAPRAARDHGVMFEVRYWEERPEGGFKPIRPMWRVEDTFARLGA